MVLSSPIGGANNLGYYKLMVFSAHLFLMKALSFAKMPDKASLDYFLLVVFVLLGLNAWAEGIIMFFALSLNLTCAELKHPESCAYLKASSKLQEARDFRWAYLTEDSSRQSTESTGASLTRGASSATKNTSTFTTLFTGLS